MIIPGGLSIIFHSSILIAKAIKKKYGLSVVEFKAGLLHLGLKISPVCCFAFFRKDSLLQRFLAFSIIIAILCLILLSATLSLKTLLQESSNFALLGQMIWVRLTAASQKNVDIGIEQKIRQFKEIPFQKEIEAQN
jgi:hypothetical protein